MKRIMYIALPLMMLITFNSCDWFNVTFLGKPSKAEVEMERLKKEKVRQDSLNLVAAEREANAQQTILDQQKATSQIDMANRYHVIVGCFKVSDNANKMDSVLQKNGYHAQKFYFKNGFVCLSAYSNDKLNTAIDEMYKILKTDIAPEDIWVYDTRTGLHKN